MANEYDNVKNPSATTPFPYMAPNPAFSYGSLDSNVFPRTYNLRKITWVADNPTEIDFYTGATSFADSGSLVFKHLIQYDGSNNPTDILVLLP